MAWVPDSEGNNVWIDPDPYLSDFQTRYADNPYFNQMWNAVWGEVQNGVPYKDAVSHVTDVTNRALATANIADPVQRGYALHNIFGTGDLTYAQSLGLLNDVTPAQGEQIGQRGSSIQSSMDPGTMGDPFNQFLLGAGLMLAGGAAGGAFAGGGAGAGAAAGEGAAAGGTAAVGAEAAAGSAGLGAAPGAGVGAGGATIGAGSGAAAAGGAGALGALVDSGAAAGESGLGTGALGAGGASTLAASSLASSGGSSFSSDGGGGGGGESGGIGGGAYGGAFSDTSGMFADDQDWYRRLLNGVPGLIGAYGASQQSRDYRDLANRYMEMGAPYRSRLESLYANPEAFLNSPEVRQPIQQGTDILAHSLSTQGNPAGSGNALQQLQNYASTQLFSRLGQERDRLAGFGGLTAYNQAAPGAAQNQIASQAGVYNALGAGTADIFNPPRRYSLADLFRMSY